MYCVAVLPPGHRRTMSQMPTVRNSTRPTTTTLTAAKMAMPHSISPMVGCTADKGSDQHRKSPTGGFLHAQHSAVGQNDHGNKHNHARLLCTVSQSQQNAPSAT